MENGVNGFLRNFPWDKITFKNAMKVGIVIFAYCLMILFIISVILAMFGVY